MGGEGLRYRPTPAVTGPSRCFDDRRSAALLLRVIDWRNTGMATGTVKWFNTTKGYGFMAP